MALAQVFSCKFCEIFKIIYFTKHLQEIISGETKTISKLELCITYAKYYYSLREPGNDRSPSSLSF